MGNETEYNLAKVEDIWRDISELQDGKQAWWSMNASIKIMACELEVHTVTDVGVELLQLAGISSTGIHGF